MTVYLILALIAAVAILALSLKSARQRVRTAEGIAKDAQARADATMAELKARERDRNALEVELQNYRSGAPRDRLAATLDGLRNVAAHTAGSRSPGVAGSSAPARDGN